MPEPTPSEQLFNLITGHAAELRLAWRRAAKFDDVAVMHITAHGESMLKDLAASAGSEARLLKVLSSRPWSGNEGGADSTVSLLVSLEQALREVAGKDESLATAVRELSGKLAAGIDAMQRERVRRLEERAHTDSLTGAMSRAAVLEQLSAESARIVRHGGLLSVVYIDVDGLKQTNDEHGHAAGDEALKTLVGTVRQNIRVSDRIGRLGGDEFLLVLPETDGAGAQAVAKKVAQLLRAEGVSVTCGAASMPESGPEPDRLIEAADAAMRAQKNSRG